MTRLLLAAAVACTAALAAAADPPPTADHLAVAKPLVPAGPAELVGPQPIDKEYPLPQDMAVAERVRAERLAWLRKSTLDVFNAHGNTKAAWADQARAAMDAYCVAYTREASLQRGLYHREFALKLKAAVAAECDDPLVKYWHVRHVVGVAGSGAEVPVAQHVTLTRDAVNGMAASPYPAWVKVHPHWNAYIDFATLMLRGGGAGVPGLQADPTAFWPDFKAMAREPDRFSREATCDFAALLMGNHAHLAADRSGAYRKLKDELFGGNVPEWTGLVIEGQYLIKSAWDARGNAPAAATSPAQMKKFHEALGHAKTSLEAAWKLDPSSARPAVAMLTVAKGLPLPRAEMEEWFRRAMTADPDSYDACWAKAEWLQPKWHGSEAEALAFARQCLRTGNYYGRLPYIAQTPVHDMAYADPADLADYTGGPEVWPGVRMIYEGHLARYPTDQSVRAAYAALATIARKWDVATAQFAAVGDDPDPWTFGSLDKYRALKKLAEDQAKAAPADKP